MAISDVQLKNGWYQVIDDNGKKIKEIHENQVGELHGIGMNFILFLKNGWFTTYDENMKKIKEIHENQVGSFKSVVGISINFEKKWLACYL